MIQRIQSFDEYADFIAELANDSQFYDPHFAYNKNNLYGVLQKEDEHAFSILKNGKAEGIFVWLIIPKEKYIEMIIGFTRSAIAFSEMLSYLESRYYGYKVDFVLNPKNAAIIGTLKERGASFGPEQQKMVQTGSLPRIETDIKVEEFSEKWKDQYCSLHRKDTWWTAKRVLSARDRFRVLLAIKDHQVIGYLDVTCCYEENEPYDLFIKQEIAYRGYELALLVKAIELNKPSQMMALVDVDALEEIEVYTAAGFTVQKNQNSIYASCHF